MRNLFFTLIALISGVASAQHINGVKTITIIQAPNQSVDFVMYGIPQNGFIESSYVVDPGLFSPASFEGKILEIGKLYKFVVRDGVIKSAEIVEGPLRDDGTFKVLSQPSTKTLSEITLDMALVDDFIAVLKEAQEFKGINGGFERLFDGHLRVATNGDSPMVTIFDTLDKSLISVPKDVVVYRAFYLFKS